MEESSFVDNKIASSSNLNNSSVDWLRKNLKFIFPCVLVVFLLFFIGLLLFNKQPNEKIIAVKGVEDSRIKTVGYIVEFKDPPLNNLSRTNESFYSAKEKAADSVLSILNKNAFSLTSNDVNNLKVRAQFSSVLNGIAVDVTEEEAEKIKESPYVKAVYPDREVRVNLYQSVPLMGANRVWELTDQANNNVTGKGVKVAILDTGVDYTNADLGATPLKERSLTKITPKPLFDEFLAYWDHTIAYDKDRLLYPLSNDSVGIYSFKDKKLTKVNLSTPISKPGIDRVFLEGQKIIYMSANSKQMGLFVKDLTTNKTTKISDLGQIGHWATAGNVDYSNGNVIYASRTGSKDAKGRVLYNIYSYDLSAKKQTKLIDNTTSLPAIHVYGKTLIYSLFISKDKGYRIFKIDLNTNKRQVLYVPKAGQLVDFKGDNILYAANAKLGYRSYYLYNLVTKKAQEIHYPADDNSVPNKYYKSESQAWTAFAEPDYPEGFIGDGVVFFETSFISDVGKMAVYDLNNNKYAKINVIIPSSTVTGSGNRICFISSGDLNIYCHVYDPNYNYALPTNLFNSKVVGGYNFIDNSNNPIDDMGHGTHVAGIVGGNGSLKGVAPGVEIVAYKVLDYSGSGSTSKILSAIDAAIATRLDDDQTNDISVLSMSLGAYCDKYDAKCGPNDVLSRAVDRASVNGITSAISAGNDGPYNSSINSPGTARTAITVGAVTKSKQITSYSSRGPVILGDEVIQKPDVLAPGHDICSSLLNGYALPGDERCFDNKHIFMSGTSMAAPHIAGVVALIKQMYSDWTPSEIKNAIMSNADLLVYPANTQGAGFVNVARVFSLFPSPTSTLTPTPTNISNSSVVKTVKTIELQPIADTYVKSDQVNTNFGKGATLIADNDSIAYSYLKFSLNSLKGKTLLKATLQVQVAPGADSESTLSKGIQAYLVNNTSWSEINLNYKTKLKNDKLLATLSGVKESGDVLSFNITSGISGKFGSLVSLSLVNLGTDGIAFNSKEATVGKPKLIIEYK